MLDLFVVLAATAGALFGAWFLLFLGFGRKLEAMEIEYELLKLKLPESLTPEEKHKMEQWENRQSFLESHKYRLVIGLMIGVGSAIGYVAIFLQQAPADTSIMAAAVAGWMAGTAGSAVAKEVRATS